MKTIPEMLKSLTRGTEGITGIQESVASDGFTETRITFASPGAADEALFSNMYRQADVLRGKLLKLGIDANSITSNVIDAKVSVDISQALYGQVRAAYYKHLVHSPAGLVSLTGHAMQDAMENGTNFLSQKARHFAEKFHERGNSGQDTEIKR